MENQQSNKTSVITITLIVLLLGSIVGNIFQWKGGKQTEETFKSTVDTLSLAKSEIESELNQTYSELDKYRGQNSQLDSLLTEARDSLDASKVRINSLIRTNRNQKDVNAKLQNELASLKLLRDQYLDKIDSLMLANKQLTADKELLSGQVESLSQNLKSTVSSASVLKTEYVKAIALRKKGADKFSETAMAKRTNKIEVSFTVLDNKFAKAGDRQVIMRLIEPGGKVVGNRSEGSKTFKPNGSNEDVLYTAMQTITYTNQKQDLKLSYEEAERGFFKPGTYTIEIFVEGNLSGSGSVTLK